MKEVTLYRGLALTQENVSDVIADIRKNGIQENKGFYKFALPDISTVQSRLEELFSNEDHNI